MYPKCGNIHAANELFLDVTYRDSVTWNAMISGYSHRRLAKEALNVFQTFKTCCKLETVLTKLLLSGYVLSACAHLGLCRKDSTI